MIMASSGKDKVITVSINPYKSKFIGARRIFSANDQKRVMLVLTAQNYLGTPYDFGAKYGQSKTLIVLPL